MQRRRNASFLAMTKERVEVYGSNMHKFLVSRDVAFDEVTSYFQDEKVISELETSKITYLNFSSSLGVDDHGEEGIFVLLNLQRRHI